MMDITDNLKNTAELIFSLGKEADRYKDQYENNNFLSDTAKGKLHNQYVEKVQQMDFLTRNLSIADILQIDEYLVKKYGYRS